MRRVSADELFAPRSARNKPITHCIRQPASVTTLPPARRFRLNEGRHRPAFPCRLATCRLIICWRISGDAMISVIATFSSSMISLAFWPGPPASATNHRIRGCRFRDGRNVRSGTSARADTERTQFPISTSSATEAISRRTGLHMAGDHVGNRRCRTAIGHFRHVRAGHALHQRNENGIRGADATGAVIAGRAFPSQA